MIRCLHVILNALSGSEKGKEPITGIHAERQFAPTKESPYAQVRNLNAAFLLCLCGPEHPLCERAENYLAEKRTEREWGPAAAFYQKGIRLITREFQNRCASDRGFAETVRTLSTWILERNAGNEGAPDPDRVWQVFFPEGVGLRKNRKEQIQALRKRRTVSLDRLNPRPLKDPAGELLFTANVLLTLPSHDLKTSASALSETVQEGVDRARGEQQLYWYDHPVLIGTPPEKNEILYGLRALNRAIAFEKERKMVKRSVRVNCVLSVSVTHQGLRKIAAPYLTEMLKEQNRLEHLRIFAFTEADTTRIKENVLLTAAQHWFGRDGKDLLGSIFGVDGEYGRHYSFLKAVAAFWQVLVDPGVRGTFKIDLDQVFPQDRLVRETGRSALEHFVTPLWGAQGTDFHGRKVDLGMIAGALVNQADSGTSLFSPDVRFPPGDITGSEWLFFSRLPQAVSTEAEMMTRYRDTPLDGLHRVIQRVHVTGGTTGILVDHLRRYRPFTPGFVGRAEDQAYLFSMLDEQDEKPLRTLHKDGLIMRHDKEAFAEEAIQAAATGKKVGDYLRVLIFSAYAGAIHARVEGIKKEVDPFTGCFVSHLPATVVLLRFALDVAELFQAGKQQEAVNLAHMGMRRIGDVVQRLVKNPDLFKERFEQEKAGWNLYYDILDCVERDLKKGDPFAEGLRREASRLVRGCMLPNF